MKTKGFAACLLLAALGAAAWFAVRSGRDAPGASAPAAALPVDAAPDAPLPSAVAPAAARPFEAPPAAARPVDDAPAGVALTGAVQPAAAPAGAADDTGAEDGFDLTVFNSIPDLTVPAGGHTSLHQVIREWEPAGLPGLEHESAEKKHLFKLDPQTLKKYEGSYSTEDLFAGSGNPLSIKLDSGWILKNSNGPQVRMRIRENPANGGYEAVGGEVELPSGVGVSYEEDSQTGEQRTFLKLKKEF